MKKTFSLLIALLLTSAAFAQTQIIAHRGSHAKNSTDNSVSALKNAQDINVYGSECDLNLTSDGYIVVAHGPNHGTHHIQSTDIQTLRKQFLKTGEVLPVLEEYLEAVKRKPETKLIIELKNHATPQKETELVKKVLKTVKKYKLEKHVEYIAFRQHVCNELVALGGKDIKVAYLNGDLSPEFQCIEETSGMDSRSTQAWFDSQCMDRKQPGKLEVVRGQQGGFHYNRQSGRSEENRCWKVIKQKRWMQEHPPFFMSISD